MNYYHILGVSENASQHEIKKSFRKLALEHHPDKTNHQNDHHFKMINEAYQVLSDPQKKANYDYRLKYQFINPTSFTSSQQNYTQKKTAPSFSEQQRQFYQKQQEKAKKAEDKRFFRQIAFTIGLIFFIAISMIYYNNQQELKIAEEKLMQENVVTSTISESKQLINEKNYKEALTKLSTTYKKYEFDERLNTESKQILEGLLSLSHFYMEQNDFAHALKIYEAIYEFAPLEDKEIYKMATCYRSVEKFNKAIELLAFLIKNNYPDYNYLYDMASIYDFDLNEHEKAVHYYELATKDIVEKYESVFGKAYIVTLNPDKLPKKHFAVFYDKGINYYRLKKYEKALGAFKWANNLQRDNDISLYYQGVCFYELKRKNDACDCWKQAYTLQRREQIKEKINQFCK